VGGSEIGGEYNSSVGSQLEQARTPATTRLTVCRLGEQSSEDELLYPYRNRRRSEAGDLSERRA
jgi:hypothetical protein